jgi:hypothetical protein
MPQQVKTIGIFVLVALTVLGTGYLWGARGRWAAEERLAFVERQSALNDARRLVLAGQVALSRLNFGEAAGLFESARAGTEAATAQMEAAGRAVAVGDLRTAGGALAEARALAAKLDQSAFGKAGEALHVLDKVAADHRQPPSE